MENRTNRSSEVALIFTDEIKKSWIKIVLQRQILHLLSGCIQFYAELIILLFDAIQASLLYWHQTLPIKCDSNKNITMTAVIFRTTL